MGRCVLQGRGQYNGRTTAQTGSPGGCRGKFGAGKPQLLKLTKTADGQETGLAQQSPVDGMLAVLDQLVATVRLAQGLSDTSLAQPDDAELGVAAAPVAKHEGAGHLNIVAHHELVTVTLGGAHGFCS